MKRFLIVGTGRSATTYCQAVHQVCGVPTTHQKVFTWASYKARRWCWGDAVGEASFMAVPMLTWIREREPDTKIVLVKRNPAEVAASWVARGAFKDDMADRYPDWHSVISTLFPSVFDGTTPIACAVRYAKAWTMYAAAYADTVLRVDDMTLPQLFEATGQTANFDAVLAGSISRRINSGPPDAG